jgi:CBS domain-containing protein
MDTIGNILVNKKGPLLSISRRESSLQAATVMSGHKVGSLLVMDGRAIVGIITERDLLERVVARARDPKSTSVDDVTTTEVFCCRPETTLEEARTVMKNRRIRHLPVVDDGGRLHGLVSIGDLNAHHAHSQELTIQVMNEMMFARCVSTVLKLA